MRRWYTLYRLYSHPAAVDNDGRSVTSSKENRKSQASFVCQRCGHTDNADRNAAINISVAAVKQPIVVGRA